ncbi:hypothetical protein IFM89_008846 [Coptis chinensis]|uniref:Uncharacterized protein n=1 Tax=Coptis chinensis TaxID=261450 RepID=A0A835LIR4_9MAGN|nr:hypothetical protein IFM89_008846 [Coptis chinensis]
MAEFRGHNGVHTHTTDRWMDVPEHLWNYHFDIMLRTTSLYKPEKLLLEALYNIARAYQHVGLVTLAASYYEKVIATQVKGYPIPKMPIEDSSLPQSHSQGYCNLRREAVYNLHLIYRKSGALDLARQVLRNHCSP